MGAAPLHGGGVYRIARAIGTCGAAIVAALVLGSGGCTRETPRSPGPARGEAAPETGAAVAEASAAVAETGAAVAETGAAVAETGAAATGPGATEVAATSSSGEPRDPLACAPDGVLRWSVHGVSELEPRGLGALRGGAPPADHYAYVCEGDRLARIERHDGSGALEGVDDVAVERITEPEAGRILVDRQDAAGRSTGTVELRRAEASPGTWQRIERDGAGSTVVTEELTLRDGLVVRRRVTSGEPPPGTPWETRIERGPRGETLRTSWADRDGAPAADTRGVWSVHTRWDERGFPVEEGFHSRDGAPMADASGLSVLKMELDHAGNQVMQTRLDVHGRPCATTEGVVSTRTRRDPLGHAIAEEKLDAGGNLVAGFRGVAGSTMQVDARGRQVRLTWRDVDGHPTTDGTGIAAYGWDYTDDPVHGRKHFYLANGTEVDRHGLPVPAP